MAAKGLSRKYNTSMAESYFGIHLCKLTTFSGTVGGQLRQVSLYMEKSVGLRTYQHPGYISYVRVLGHWTWAKNSVPPFCLTRAQSP